MKSVMKEFCWVGSEKHLVDEIRTDRVNQVVIGRFGGNSSAGQYKNEDGCLVWTDQKEQWEMAILLDAHNTAESAELVIQQFTKHKAEMSYLLSLPFEQTFGRLESAVLGIFQDEEFLAACQQVRGETACLIVVRKDKYLWWFSVGDCVSYVFHPELAALGQYQVNQRQFYEWVGQVNTFAQVLPCYSSGVKELRKGVNRIFLTTDGLLECPNEPFLSPKEIYKVMSRHEIEVGLLTLLQVIRENSVRDSTTIIAWEVNVDQDVTRPSDE